MNKEWEWKNNTYYLGQNSEPTVFNGKEMSLDELQKIAGLAVSPQVKTHKPSGVQSHVIPNEHDPSRAHVALYNWGEKSHVPLDLGKFLKPGDRYTLYSTLDYRGEPLAEGAYQEGPVMLAVPQDTVVGRQFHGLIIHRRS